MSSIVNIAGCNRKLEQCPAKKLNDQTSAGIVFAPMTNGKIRLDSEDPSPESTRDEQINHWTRIKAVILECQACEKKYSSHQR